MRSGDLRAERKWSWRAMIVMLAEEIRIMRRLSHHPLRLASCLLLASLVNFSLMILSI